MKISPFVLLFCLFSLGPLRLIHARQPDFGKNVTVFDPSMQTSQIQAAVYAVANQQVDNEFGTPRYALLFMPGTYGSAAGPLDFQVGYYTEVAGLGASPTDVTINGHVDVYNRCLTPTNCIALDNFWRSLSNLTINVKGLSGCRASGDFWAVSQAAPLRRVKITGGNLTLQDYCTAGPQYASGGFISDSQTGFIINGSQQQFLVRDSSIGGWSNGVWNQVFSGVVGAPPQSFSATPFNPPPYTTLATSPVTREKPFLYVDSYNHYNVFVPALRRDSLGTTWANGPAAGSSIPIESFFIAKPTDSAKAINVALARGQNLILTPGIYDIWAWRADHGNGVDWLLNTADTGVIVNGDNVTAYGLFVEHYQKYQAIWNGENGRTIMFQNEMPYDPPNQAAWQHDDVLGYAPYKVADSVETHEGWGLGSYCFFNVDPTIHATRAFEVPDAPGVKLHDLLTVSLGGVGVIDHVANNTGAAAQGVATIPVNLVSYP
jgi:hypothetical protein